MMLAITVGARIAGLMPGNATSEQTIEVNGVEDVLVMSFDGTIMDDMIIPSQISFLEHGDTKYFHHNISYTGEDCGTVRMTYEINDSWFAEPGHPFYGLQYGVQIGPGWSECIGNPTACQLAQGEIKEIRFWFSAHEDMASCENLTTTLWINGTKV